MIFGSTQCWLRTTIYIYYFNYSIKMATFFLILKNNFLFQHPIDWLSGHPVVRPSGYPAIRLSCLPVIRPSGCPVNRQSAWLSGYPFGRPVNSKLIKINTFLPITINWHYRIPQLLEKSSMGILFKNRF